MRESSGDEYSADKRSGTAMRRQVATYPVRKGTGVIDETLRDADQKMTKAVEVAKDDFATIRTGRAHPAMFNKLTADYYGTPTPIQQLASFSNPEPRVVLINAYDKQALAGIS